MVGNGPGCCVVGPLLNSGSAVSWQPQDQEAIRQALALPATVPCLDAIGRAMADLERHHPAGVISSCWWAGREQEQAIEKLSSSGPIAGSVAAGGDAPLQKADVIAYDTALLRQESETAYANPRSSAAALLRG